MGAAKPTYINGFREFQEEVINWSADTIRRRIRTDGLPAIKVAHGYVFDRKEVELWFKRRSEKVG